MDHLLFATLTGLQGRIEREEKLWFQPVGAHNEYEWAREQPIRRDVRLLADPADMLNTLIDFRDNQKHGDPRVRERLREQGYALLCIHEGTVRVSYHVQDRIVLLRERENYITD